MEARKRIWYGLGILWLIDGILQAQPAMFTPIFPDMVLRPTMDGQPIWLSALLQFGISRWQQHPVFNDAMALLVQLLIGLLLITGYERRRGKVGLWLSLGWGVVVWVFGEGMGGLFSGSPSILSGSPGSAFFYIMLSIVLLWPITMWESGRLTSYLKSSAALYFFIGALWEALPSTGYWQSDNLMSVFGKSAGMPQPYWIRAEIEWVATSTYHHPVPWNLGIIIMLCLIGYLILEENKFIFDSIILYLFLFMIWWMGQDFGFLGGYGTDVNTIPLIGLVLFSVSGKRKMIVKRWSHWHQLGHF